MDEEVSPEGSDDDGVFFVATGPMDEPGEVDARLVTSYSEYQHYQENGWDLDGPYNEQKANAKMEKLSSDNKKWRHYSSNQFDDRDNYDLGNLHDFDRGDF